MGEAADSADAHPDPEPVQVEITTSRVSDAGASRFRNVCEALHQAMQLVLIDRCGLPGFPLGVVLTEDLTAEVQRHRDAAAQDPRPFVAERLGGMVVAKCLHSQTDGATVIVFDDIFWRDDTDESALASGCTTIAHEMAHCALHELRGRADRGGLSADQTVGEQAAREIVSDALEEYRADGMAGAFLGAMGERVEDGASHRLRLHDIHGDEYAEQLLEVLDNEVYPGWRDRVQLYREYVVPLEEMFLGVSRSAWEAFVLVAHAAAVADSSGKPDPLDEYTAHPAVRIYLRDPWQRIRELAGEYPLLGTPAESMELEARALDTGVAAVMRMWKSLGLTFRLQPSGDTYIHVDEPQSVGEAS